MASRQLGKLRQWAGEVISSREKTAVSDELKELEEDVELRRAGLQRLCIASEAYHTSISKKKHSDALDESEKLMPVDTLGIVMLQHGEDFGGESVFGTSLVKIGRAHCKIATLQEAYALTFRDTFLQSMHKFADEIGEYDHLRKKLDSRRLSYDAAVSKAEKARTSKKERDRLEAEDELERAKQRYDETSEDIRAHIQAVQENEIDQMRELTAFLELEMRFVEQYWGVLKDVKSEWASVHDVAPKRHRSSASQSSKHKPEVSSPGLMRSLSMRSSRSQAPSTAVSDTSDNEDDHATVGRRPSHRRSGSNKSMSKPSVSRRGSMASRKRSDSSTTAGGREEKEKEKEKESMSKRMGISGWASSAASAVGSVRGSKKNKDKFASLDDERDSDSSPPIGSKSPSLLRRGSSKSKSKDSLSSTSPRVPPRIIQSKRSAQERIVVKALYDFTGSTDELAFKAGDEITVVSEVLEEWWMGELDGRKGLFPSSFTQVVKKSPHTSNGNGNGKPGRNGFHLDYSDDSHDGFERDTDEESVYSSKPLAHSQHSPFFGGHAEVGSIDSSGQSESELAVEEQNLVPSLRRRDDDSPPSLPARLPSMQRAVTDTGVSRKAPPPPPPRRVQTNTQMLSPPLPARRQSGNTLQTSSSGSSLLSTSPFDSAADLTVNGAGAQGCAEFTQHPFKNKGVCNNCFQVHE